MWTGACRAIVVWRRIDASISDLAIPAGDGRVDYPFGSR